MTISVTRGTSALILRWKKIFAALLFISSFVGVAKSDVIVGFTSNTPAGFGTIANDQTLAVSWTISGAYTNVSIDVPLYGLDPSFGTNNFYAVLTHQIGPGTPFGSPPQVAGTPVLSFPNGYGELNLFSGLTLPAGTYYLVLVANLGGGGWQNLNSTSSVTTAGDASYNGSLHSQNTNPSTPLQNPFEPVANTFLVSVTGTPVPEPSTVAVFLIGAGVITLVGRHRRA